MYDTLISFHPEICDIVEQSTTCLNVTCCFVAFKHSQTAVLSIYRSPSTCCKTAITELQSILLQLSTFVKYFIIAGDFNIDLQSSLSTSNEYKNLLDDFCLTQHIVAPSRVCDSSATLIDHISSSNQFSVTHSCQAVGLSDHYMQCVDFRAPVCSQEVRKMWICSFRKCDWDKLRETLRYAPWHVISTFDDIDDRWEMFHSILLDVLNSFAPLWRVSSRKSKGPTSWFNECISAKIKAKNCAKRIATRSGSEEDKEIYRRLKNELKTVIREAKTTHLRAALSRARANPKLAAYLWKCVNGVIGRDKSHTTDRASTGCIVGCY